MKQLFPPKPVDRRIRSVEEMQPLVKQHPTLADELFGRGFLVTTRAFDAKGYPFFGRWAQRSLGAAYKISDLFLYTHPRLAVHEHQGPGRSIYLLGHAYDPFEGEADEDHLLAAADAACESGAKALDEFVAHLSGTFVLLVVETGRVTAVQDSIGLRALCYGRIGADCVITSHAQMAGDLFTLPRDRRVEELANSRAYNIARRQLPGNLTPFDAVRRLGGNFMLTLTDKFSVRRLFPDARVDAVSPGREVDELLQQVASLVHESLRLISEKWSKPAISLSGGTDSRTTLACAAGLYERFDYFSFHAKPQERTDALAASKLCSQVGVQHVIYSVPEDDAQVDDYPAMKAFIDHNTGYVFNLAPHEIRKVAFLRREYTHDIEVKSWASEIGRAYLDRRYGTVLPARLTARHYSLFQTRHMSLRTLRWADRANAEYLDEHDSGYSRDGVNAGDLYYWEGIFSNWGAISLTAQSALPDITVPLNNRRLLSMLLRFPREFRGRDEMHRRLVQLMNPDLAGGIEIVKNESSSSRRTKMERVFLKVGTRF